MVLIIFGFIYGIKSAMNDALYMFIDQSFGALCTISICVSGLMGLPLVVSEYRERKILKRFQVTPVSPFLLLIVELTIYVVYCFVSMLSLLIVAMLVWKVRIIGSWMAFVGSWLLTMISTLSIGMMVGGIAKNTKIASVLYFPMLIFSGATLPLEIILEMMQKIFNFFPMTQGIQLMKTMFLGLSTQNVWISILSMMAVTMLCTMIVICFFQWK